MPNSIPPSDKPPKQSNLPQTDPTSKPQKSMSSEDTGISWKNATMTDFMDMFTPEEKKRFNDLLTHALVNEIKRISERQVKAMRKLRENL